MVMFRENRELVALELENLILRIHEEHQVSNLVFMEQTDHYCVFRGHKNGTKCYLSLIKIVQ